MRPHLPGGPGDSARRRRRRGAGFVLLTLLALLTTGRPAGGAETLLAAISTDGTILVVDPATGLANPVLTYSGLDALSAIAFDAQGTLWGVDANRGSPFLMRIHAFSGTALPVGPTGLGPGVKLSGLDEDPVTGKLFAIQEATGDIYTIDTFSGAATWIGNAGSGTHVWKGLTFDPLGRAFALRAPASSPIELVELDPLTWLETQSCPLPAVQPFVVERLESRQAGPIDAIAKSFPFFGDNDNWLTRISPAGCALETIGPTSVANGIVDGGLTMPPACGIPPLSRPYGTGTQGSAGIPQIATNVLPNVPSLQPLDVRITNAKPLTPVVAVFSFLPLLPGQVPLFGGSLLVDPSAAAGQAQVMSDAQGDAVVSIGMVPPALALCALQLFVQGFVLEGPPAGGGIILTSGLELTFGS